QAAGRRPPAFASNGTHHLALRYLRPAPDRFARDQTGERVGAKEISRMGPGQYPRGGVAVWQRLVARAFRRAYGHAASRAADRLSKVVDTRHTGAHYSGRNLGIHQN